MCEQFQIDWTMISVVALPYTGDLDTIHINSSLNQNQINATIVQCFQHFNQIRKKHIHIKCVCVHCVFICPYKMLFHAMINVPYTRTHTHTYIKNPIHENVISWGHYCTFWYCYHSSNASADCTHISHLNLVSDATHVNAENLIFYDICHVESNSSNDNKSISIWKSHIWLTQKIGKAKLMPKMHW